MPGDPQSNWRQGETFADRASHPVYYSARCAAGSAIEYFWDEKPVSREEYERCYFVPISHRSSTPG